MKDAPTNERSAGRWSTLPRVPNECRGDAVKRCTSLILLTLGLFATVPSAASSQVLLVLLFGDKLSSESLQAGIKLDAAALRVLLAPP